MPKNKNAKSPKKNILRKFLLFFVVCRFFKLISQQNCILQNKGRITPPPPFTPKKYDHGKIGFVEISSGSRDTFSSTIWGVIFDS